VKRRLAIAGLLAATLLALLWWRGSRAPGRTAVRELRTALTTALLNAGERRALAIPPQPLASPAVDDSPRHESTPSVAVEAFLDQYADEVCLCSDMECVADVGRRYNPRMGHTTRPKDNAAIHASSLRVRDCVRQISTGG